MKWYNKLLLTAALVALVPATVMGVTKWKKHQRENFYANLSAFDDQNGSQLLFDELIDDLYWKGESLSDVLEKVHTLRKPKTKKGNRLIEDDDIRFVLGKDLDPKEYIAKAKAYFEVLEAHEVAKTHYIDFLYRREISPESLDNFLSLRNQKGEAIFSPIQVGSFHKKGATLVDARKFLSYGDLVDSYESMFGAFSWGLTEEEITGKFRDTTKPSAIITLAEWGTAYNDYTDRSFFRRIRKTYNAHFAFVSNDREMFETSERVPDAEFWYLLGHANSYEMVLSKPGARWRHPDPEIQAEYERAYWSKHFDLGDQKRLKAHIARLHPSATILLGGCGMSDGDHPGYAMADMVVEVAQGRTIFASTAELDAGYISVESMHPFRATIRGERGGIWQDTTFTNRTD